MADFTEQQNDVQLQLNTCQILIVDDDPDDIDLLRSSFYEIGVKEINGVFFMNQVLEYL